MPERSEPEGLGLVGKWAGAKINEQERKRFPWLFTLSTRFSLT